MTKSRKDIENSWILCKSQRTPGQFYYFNRLTRAAVWKLQDLVRMPMQNPDPPTDNWHSYPEPDYPPPDDFQGIRQPQFSNCHQMFGKASFRNYTNNDPIWSQGSSSSSPFGNPTTVPIYDPGSYANQQKWFQKDNVPREKYYDAKMNNRRNGPFENQQFHNPGMGRPLGKHNMFKQPSLLKHRSQSQFLDEENGHFSENPPFMQQFSSDNRYKSQPFFLDNDNQNLSKRAAFMNYREPQYFDDENQYDIPRQRSFVKYLSPSQHIEDDHQYKRQPSFTKYRTPTKRSENLFATRPATIQKPDFLKRQQFQPQNKSFQSSKSLENLTRYNDNSIQIGQESGYVCRNTVHRSNSLDSLMVQDNTPMKHTETYGFFQNRLTNSKSFENLTDPNMYRPPNRFAKQVFNSNNTLNPKHYRFKFGDTFQNRKVQKQTIQTDFMNQDHNKRNQTSVFAKTKTTQTEKNWNESVQTENLQTEVQNKDEPNLPETDLRYVLLARKRKTSLSSSAPGDISTEAKKIKTGYLPEETEKNPEPRKHVTFDLGVEEYSNTEDEPACVDPDTTDILTSNPEDPAQIEPVNGQCCVIADTDVLVKEFPLIEQFVLSDECYTLLIPLAVKRELEAVSTGNGNGRKKVLNARQVLRKLAEQHEHIIIQPPETQEESTEYTDDPLLICCLQVLDEGVAVVLVTDNEEIYAKADSLGIICYTTQDVKDDLSDPKTVAFEYDENDTNASNNKAQTLQKQFFREETDERNRFFLIQNELPLVRQKIELLKLNDERDGLNVKKVVSKSCGTENLSFEDSVRSGYKDNVTERSGFKDVTERSGFKDNVTERSGVKDGNHERSGCRDSDAQRSGFKDGGAGRSGETKNGCQVMEVTSTANKKREKSINAYNLKEHLKKFLVKDKAVEERIRSRIDEWVCSFSQIMEVTLSDALKSLGIPYERPAMWRAPLWELALAVQSAHTSPRAVPTLAAALAHCHSADRSTSLKPNDFMKMLGYGTLLIKSLKAIHPKCTELAEGEVLLDQLLQDVLNGSPAPPSPPAPAPAPAPAVAVAVAVASPHLDQRRAPNYVKNHAEIHEYLKNNYPNWQSDDMKNDYSDELKGEPKIVRTNGKNLGLVKLNTDKTITDGTNDLAKESDEQTTKLSGAKLLKKLVVESTNLPPKMKEIDVEKREQVNKEISDMINTMISDKTNSGQNDISEHVKVPSKMDLKSGLGLTRTFVNVHSKSIDKQDVDKDTTQQVKSIFGNTSTNKFKNLPKITRVVQNRIEDSTENAENPKDGVDSVEDSKKLSPVDLDALDYSDTYTEEDNTLVLETVHSHDHENNNNSVQNDHDNLQNEVNNNDQILNEELVIDGRGNEELESVGDSGFNDNDHYYFIKLFLIETSNVLNNLVKFITECKKCLITETEFTKENYQGMHEKANKLLNSVNFLVLNLKSIKEREASDPLPPSIAQIHHDHRLMEYRKVVALLIKQSRLLRDMLRLIFQITSCNLDVFSTTSASSEMSVDKITAFIN